MWQEPQPRLRFRDCRSGRLPNPSVLRPADRAVALGSSHGDMGTTTYFIRVRDLTTCVLLLSVRGLDVMNGSIVELARRAIASSKASSVEVEEVLQYLRSQCPDATIDELEESVLEAATRSGVAVFWRGGPEKKPGRC